MFTVSGKQNSESSVGQVQKNSLCRRGPGPVSHTLSTTFSLSTCMCACMCVRVPLCLSVLRLKKVSLGFVIHFSYLFSLTIDP